jgi:hypothetical protein
MRYVFLVALLLGRLSVARVNSAGVTPSQVHLAQAGTLGMRVAWFTPNATATSTCVYGTSPSSLSLNASGTAVNYFPEGGYHHRVKLSGLAPKTQYFYACGDGTPDGTTPTLSFTQPSSSALSNGEVFGTLIFGDMGWLDSQRECSILRSSGIRKAHFHIIPNVMQALVAPCFL